MDGQGHVGPDGGQGHGKHGDADGGEQDHVHAHEETPSISKWLSLVCALVAGGLILHTIEHSSLQDVRDSAWKIWARGTLSSSDDAAKAWREQMQMNANTFAFAPQGAKYIDPLRELSKSGDKDIACPALVRLGYAYFSIGEFTKAGAELDAAEARCSERKSAEDNHGKKSAEEDHEKKLMEELHQKKLMEEIHHLHGRAHNEMARRRELPETVRRAYEELAWNSFNMSLTQLDKDKREFTAVTVLQMCTLSEHRPDGNLTELQRHLEDAIIDRRALEYKLIDNLTHQERSIRRTVEVRAKSRLEAANQGSQGTSSKDTKDTNESSSNLTDILKPADTRH